MDGDSVTFAIDERLILLLFFDGGHPTAEGFEVFSVSLDSDIPRWEAAIKKDDLSWKHHVSDLKKWDNEAAAMYGVSSIPMSFLVDPNGIIVAKNLRGIELHRQLDKYVTSF